MRYFLLIFLFSIQVLAQTALDSPQNVIINGGMDIWQRYTAPVTGLAVSAFLADRWQYSVSTDGQVTIDRSTDVPAGTYGYSLKLDVTTADGTIGAAQYGIWRTTVEGFDIAPLLGKYVTLGFWVKSTVTGTAAIYLRNAASNRVLVLDYTINTTNTWEEKFVSFYFDPTGTWETGNLQGLSINFTIACGSDYDGATSGVWGTTVELCTAASAGFNAYSSTSNDFFLDGVRLYAGTQKKPFVRAGGTYAGELAMSQRYFWRQTGPARLTTNFFVTTNYIDFIIRHPTTMRTDPIACIIGGSAATHWDVLNLSGTAQTFTSQTGVTNVSTTATGYFRANKNSHGLTAAALGLLTTDGYIECSAEY